MPVVLRLPVGGGMGAGPFHSQNPEAWFVHVAGVKVVAPATPRDAKGLLLFTPEYNNSIPGPFKNAIDWLSRPANENARVFGGKPVALMGASPGRFGTLSAQTAWLPVFRVLGLQPWFATPLYLSAIHKAVDDQHRLVDPETRDRLRKFLVGFAAFVG